MPEIHLPIFPSGVTHITPKLAFEKRDGQVTYFNGFMPVFTHEAADISTFRMITAQFCVTGYVRQSQIARTFGIPLISVKRAVKRYRQYGTKGFFEPRKKRGATVLTKDVLVAAQRLFDGGDSVAMVAEKLGLKEDTLRKAVTQKRLHRFLGAGGSIGDGKELVGVSSTKSGRSIQDIEAPMGMGATNTMDRIAASFGMLQGVEAPFSSCIDVPNGGLLFALPSLLVCGLLRHTAQYFSLPAGYYRMESIFLLLAFMALGRLKSVESLRYCAPGEWGKLLGLDRIPEVRTLREKIGWLSTQGAPEDWSATLSQEWMNADPGHASALYIDGHVRVYNGHQTKLPRHYVARERLCLRATTDYWVNAMDGQPFFVVSKEVDPGLLRVLEDEIVPRLEQDVPKQPTAQELNEYPLQHRFCLIFDREGYSPGFIKRMKEKHIACLTYHKFPGEDWSKEEFLSYEVRLASGERVRMDLAERGVYLGKQVWLREVRKLTDSGHQTSLLATNYSAEVGPLAAAMFARWSQENFFGYMREHYGLDRLIDHKTEPIPDTTRVINPVYRKLDGDIRSKASILNRKLKNFGAIHLEGPIGQAKVEKFQLRKAQMEEKINAIKGEIAELKTKRANTKKHIEASQLPQPEKFCRLRKDSKHFIDTVKMIAYRAETSMAYTTREKMARKDDARTMLRGIFSAEADIIPDENNKTLTIRLHNIANNCEADIIRFLCQELNQTESIFPGTNLRLVYESVSSENPGDQDV